MGKKNPQQMLPSSTLTFGAYNPMFKLLEQNKPTTIVDTKSEQHSSIPVLAYDTESYITEPDGKLIPQINNQRKCDYLIYCKNIPQTSFIELKGANISTKKGYNPYDQIIDTIAYLNSIASLKDIVNSMTEKHAFIVSPRRQKIPKGVETKERRLWQALIQQSSLPKSLCPKASDIVHYVKVTPSDRYSDKNGQIICSSKFPIRFPFHHT